MKPILVFLPLILAFSACAPTPEAPELDPDAVERKMLSLQKNFNVIDTNDDDSVSPAEVKKAMIGSGSEDVSALRISKIMKFYDFNKDGKIDLREAQSGAVSGPEALIKKIEQPAPIISVTH